MQAVHVHDSNTNMKDSEHDTEQGNSKQQKDTDMTRQN